MSSPPLDSQRLRLLVALAVLKCKPVNQTCFVYIQSLKACFPSVQPNRDALEPSWKERVFSLENDCKNLKEKLEQAKLQTFVQVGNDGTQPSVPPDPNRKTTASNPSAGKKKAKPKQDICSGQDATGSSFDLKTLIKIMGNSSKKGDLSARLFETFETFFSVSALHGRTDFPEDAFVSLTCRAIDALSVALQDHILKDDMHLGRVQMVDTLLRLMIQKSLPIIGNYSFPPKGSLDLNHWSMILDKLSRTILVPLIGSFFVLSKRNLGYLLLDDQKRAKSSRNDGGQTTKDADGRPAMLGLFHGAITAIQSNMLLLAQPHLTTTNRSKKSSRARAARCRTGLAELSLLHHSLILQSIHHLNQILSDGIIPSPGSAKARRVLRLALKDTIWYICSVLHILINLNVEFNAVCPPDVTLSDSDNRNTDSSNNNDGSCKPSVNASRLSVLKKSVLNCFLGLLIRQDRARRLEHATHSAMPILLGHSPIEPRCQGSDDKETVLGDGQSQHGQGAAIQTQFGVEMGASLADADGGSGRSIHNQAGQLGPSSPASDRGLDDGAGDNGPVGGDSPGVDVIHPACSESKKKDRMHVVLDDREYGMLLGVVENYFNLPCILS